MTVQRFFLGWDRPVVDSVSDFILSKEIDDPVDLTGRLIVVPTRLAGRRLKESLLKRCVMKNSALLSCRIVTPPIFFRDDDPGIADELAVSAAWVQVLRNVDITDYKVLFPVAVEQDLYWAMSTGLMLQELRGSLSDGSKRVSDIEKSGVCGEPERWKDLTRLEMDYLSQIAKMGLKDPFVARLNRSENPTLLGDVNEIILAALPDPTPLMVKALEQLSDKITVDVLVHAPQEMGDYFDSWGRPITDKWRDRYISIPDPDSNVILAESPMAESRRALELIAGESRRFGLDDIAIGVPDGEVTRYLVSDLGAQGMAAFDGSGEKLGEHPIFALLDAFFRLTREGKYSDFAGLIRHPDLLGALKTNHRISAYKLLEELDQFQNRYLPTSFSDVENRLLEVTSGHTGMTRDLGNLIQGMGFAKCLIDAFHAANIETGIRMFLKTVYSTKNLNRERDEDARFIAAAEDIGSALTRLGDMSDSVGRFERSELFQLLLNTIRGHRYYHGAGKSAINLEGWLELLWENAPFLLVTGANEGSIPTRKPFDAFLPDALRRNLGLKCDDDILARDSYIMTCLVESRRVTGRIAFILARLSQDGDPLKPSSLLFHCPDGELLRRAKRLFAESPSAKKNYPPTISFRLDAKLPPDTPVEVLHLRQLSVTKFKSYLACPFRFYLAEVLGMEEISDEKGEMDARDFGSFIHDALHRMAQDPDMKRCLDENRLRDFLYYEAERCAKANYGPSYPLHIGLQLDAAKGRLGAVARAHVEMAREGWDINASETTIQAEIGGMLVKGRVDRIDRNRKDGRIRLYDYKTSDKAENPADTHLGTLPLDAVPYLSVDVGGKNKRWKDLQLPLYRILLPEAEYGEHIEVGYFNIPKSLNDTGFVGWDGLDMAMLESAKKCALGIVHDIQSLKFWPPSDKVPFESFGSVFPASIEECVKGEEFQAYLEGRRGNAQGH
jgi:ATP-dependent helicase/nuclease subunit B